MKKRTDPLGTDMLGGGYTKWLDQTLELVKPPTPPQQEPAPKLRPPKPRQSSTASTYLTGAAPAAPSTPYAAGLQVGQKDAGKLQTQTSVPQQKWDEVKLEQPLTPASSYLTGAPATPSLTYAAGPQAGLGTIGSALVDAGASLTQTGIDGALSALTGAPGNMAPFTFRAFGGGTQKARQDGADEQGQLLYGSAVAAKELFTEGMFNLALPFRFAYGEGSFDDAVKRGINKAVNKFAKTETGKRVLGGFMTLGAGAAGEGLEEFVGDWMEWQMPRLYGGDVASVEETTENSLYDFLVGTLAGAMGGSVTPEVYQYNAGSTVRVEDGDAAQTQKTVSTGDVERVEYNRGESGSVVKQLASSIPELEGDRPVAHVNWSEIERIEGYTIAEKARTLFARIKGIVTQTGFGDVEINDRAIKDNLSHGVGPAKAAVIPAIPEVIRKGRQIDFAKNWKGRAYDGYVFAAPVDLDGETVYVAAVIKKTSKNRFYLHEVVDFNGNIIKMGNGGGANQTSLAATGDDAGTLSPLLGISIPQPTPAVKPLTKTHSQLAREAQVLFGLPFVDLLGSYGRTGLTYLLDSRRGDGITPQDLAEAYAEFYSEGFMDRPLPLDRLPAKASPKARLLTTGERIQAYYNGVNDFRMVGQKEAAGDAVKGQQRSENQRQGSEPEQQTDGGHEEKEALTEHEPGSTIGEKKGKGITAITDEAIDRVPVVQLPAYTAEECETIRQQHQELLRYAREENQGKEVAFVFRTGMTDRAIFTGSDDALDFGSSLSGTDLIVMHNHPRNSSFSLRDIAFLLRHDGVKCMTIVKNNGGVEILFKTDAYDKKKAVTEMQRYYKRYVITGEDQQITKAVQKFLKKGLGGFQWIMNGC